ncbi:hypothetical protein ILUMI_12610 [Ignelater luminosus]|uniref:Uncharacterized protein n=1 Tax=Ignelater luminosus TaxID=2038154 RepID=A0A8K0GCS5_IGNLU|nr:hypothetical protein ILUMI_12610 [Ignelater luminosus]
MVVQQYKRRKFVANPQQHFYQDDYTVKVDVLHVVSYNHSYGRDVKAGLVWYNRTTRTVNASGYLLKDLGTDMSLLTYRFLSNEYRPNGMFITINLCREANVDRFGVAKTIQDSVNFQLKCPVKKGFLSITHGTVDFSKFPPHLHAGKYRAQIKVYDGPNFLAEFYIDSEITEKIKKWELERIFD